MEDQGKSSVIPNWQRAICGLFALSGLIVTFMTLGCSIIPLLASVLGTFLFGFAAVTGRLPHSMRRPGPGDEQS